jgi:hypothetical protein
MGNALLCHTVNNLKCKAQAEAFMNHKERAESYHELLRMINRDHIRTLGQINKELKKRNLN